jgi:hypothetical protein
MLLLSQRKQINYTEAAMKRLLGILTIVSTSALLSAATLMGADNAPGYDRQKDECLLVSMNCRDNVDSIQQRIERLNREIAKGTDVYTVDELRVLRDRLDDATRNLNSLINNS